MQWGSRGSGRFSGGCRPKQSRHYSQGHACQVEQLLSRVSVHRESRAEVECLVKRLHKPMLQLGRIRESLVVGQASRLSPRASGPNLPTTRECTPSVGGRWIAAHRQPRDQTGAPIIASVRLTPIVLRKVLFPAMFAPVSRSTFGFPLML